MRITFEFPSSVEFSACSSISGQVSAFRDDGTSALLTPTGSYSIASATISGIAGSAELARQYFFDAEVYAPAAASAVFIPGAYNIGTYTFVVESDDGDVVAGSYDTSEVARQIHNLLVTEAVFAATTGSSVVNTTLNEMLLYIDTPDAAGAISTGNARTSILARYKLYDDKGKATSINPVIKEAYQVAYDDYIYGYMTTGFGSNFK